MCKINNFFHGLKSNNFLGVLSRGLLMPKIVVDDFGITRTDIGCLGYGIYFSESVSISLKYTTSSITRHDKKFLTNMKFDDGNIYFNIVTLGSDNDVFLFYHQIQKRILIKLNILFCIHLIIVVIQISYLNFVNILFYHHHLNLIHNLIKYYLSVSDFEK